MEEIRIIETTCPGVGDGHERFLVVVEPENPRVPRILDENVVIRAVFLEDDLRVGRRGHAEEDRDRGDAAAARECDGDTGDDQDARGNVEGFAHAEMREEVHARRENSHNAADGRQRDDIAGRRADLRELRRV